jgi:hypothetical protein
MLRPRTLHYHARRGIVWISMKARRIFLGPALLLIVALLALPARAERRTKIGVGGSFGLGASIPRGDLWSVEPRATVGFSLSLGLRVLFGHTCTMPTLFFIPAIVDTEKDDARNGSYLAGLLGMQIYPYNVLFVQPYFMFAAGIGWVSYTGPSTRWATMPEQSGEGKGVSILVGGGVDFNLYQWFSIGPSFFWNPVWWADCSRETYLVASDPCNPTEDSWTVKFWFVGLRMSANFEW